MISKVVILGGGISGLVTAHELARCSPAQITLVESSTRLGGVIRTLRPEFFEMEAAVDTLDGKNGSVLELCKDLELESYLAPCESALAHFFLKRNREIFPVGFSSEIFKNNTLTLAAKMRMLGEVMIPRRKDAMDESVGSFIRRRFGNLFFTQIVQPVIRGGMMADPDDLGVGEYFKRWVEAESRFGSLIRAVLSGKFPGTARMTAFSVRGGMDRLVAGFLKRLPEIHVLLNSMAVTVRKDQSWIAELEDGTRLSADAICLALPAHESSRVLDKNFSDLSHDLEKINYETVAVINLVFPAQGFPREFSKTGFFIPGNGRESPFSSVKFCGPEETGAWIRMKVFIAEKFYREVFLLEDKALLGKVSRNLEEQWGFPKPFWAQVERYWKAIAQYPPGHRNLVREIDSRVQRHPGLFLAGNGYRGFGVSDCIERARETARRIADFLNRK